MTAPRQPAVGVLPAPDVNLAELTELLEVAREEAKIDRVRLERDARLARSIHTFYGPSAAKPPVHLTAVALRKFGERVRLV